MTVPAGLHVRDALVEGVGPWLWIASDRWAWEHPAAAFPALRAMLLSATPERRVIVQAGGCLGMYPRLWSDHFRTVYTFEPDPFNFYCLTANCPSDRIMKIQAALSDRAGVCGLDRGPDFNSGLTQVSPQPGRFLTLPLDAFAFDCLDAIQLDCEGHEAKIIEGALNTIDKHHPAIAIEAPSPALCERLFDRGYVKVGECGGAVPPLDTVFRFAAA